MATGDKRVQILDKKVLGLVELGTRFLTYLLKASRDDLTAIFPRRGLFAPVEITADGANHFKLSQVYGTTGSGKIAYAAALDALISAISFENALGVPYYVGAAIAEAPDEAEHNVRTGAGQYPDTVEFLGYQAAPTSVTDNGDGTITFNVASVTEAGVTNAGRSVRVWMVTPASGVTATAIETCSVVWGGGVNKITTVSHFGQTAISVNPADYLVMLIGPRVSRGTDLSAVSDVIYLGTVTGAGAGNPPAVFSTAGQYVFPNFESMVSDVLELDAHGKWRICVRADGSDSKTPQISVKDSGGTRQIWIDEAGRFHHALEPGAYNGIPLGGAASGGSATTQDNQIDALLPANIWGSLNRVADHERILSAGLSNAILSGCAVSAGFGLFVDVAPGVVVGSGRLIVHADQPALAVADNATLWVIWNGSAFVTSATFPAAGETPAARITTVAGAVASVVDLRILLNDLDQQVDLNVGGPAAHFATLGAAISFINAMARPTSGVQTRSWRILIRGRTVETAQIVFDTGGLLIQGVPGTIKVAGTAAGGSAEVTWHGDFALFDFNGQDSITFSDVSIVYDDSAAVVPQAAASRFAFNNSAAGSATQITFRGVSISSDHKNKSVGNSGLHGFLESSGAGGWQYLRIVDCEWRHGTDSGIATKGGNIAITGSRILGEVATVQTATPKGGIVIDNTGGSQIIVTDCQISNWPTSGLRLEGATAAKICGNSITGIGGIAAAPDVRGIYVDNLCTDIAILGNFLYGLTTALGNAYGIHADGDKTLISGNNVRILLGAPIIAGIELDVDSQYCIVDANQTNSTGLIDLGAANSIGAQNRDDA